MDRKWYCARDGRTGGPYTADEMRQFAASGKLRPDDLIWKEGMADWVPAAQASSLFPRPSAPSVDVHAGLASAPGAWSGSALPTAAPRGASAAGARAAVRGPAIGLLITGVAGGLVCVFSGLNTLISGIQEKRDLAYSVGVVIGVGLILCVDAFICFAGLRMLKLREFRSACTASVLAMVPCFGCCWIGLPVGIWSLVVLMRPEIKSSFLRTGFG